MSIFGLDPETRARLRRLQHEAEELDREARDLMRVTEAGDRLILRSLAVINRNVIRLGEMVATILGYEEIEHRAGAVTITFSDQRPKE